ncbi:MAG TPA: hypothetical protein VGM84_06205 [Steroidobacteraceae bacterium]
METITVAASRGSLMSGTETGVLVGSALIIAVVGWMVFKHFRNHRHHEPRV